MLDFQKQVDRSHYAFRPYMTQERWFSIWHQLDEIQALAPGRVLEVGPGPGLFKSVAAAFGIAVETLDLDPALRPDHLGSATAMPFADGSYDVVCAFQMLEHLPYDAALRAFAEMRRVSCGHMVISLPDARRLWRYRIHLPRLGGYDLLLPAPRLGAPRHRFDGQHYWEINKRGYELPRVITDFSRHGRLLKTYRVAENTYHRFFVFAKA